MEVVLIILVVVVVVYAAYQKKEEITDNSSKDNKDKDAKSIVSPTGMIGSNNFLEKDKPGDLKNKVGVDNVGVSKKNIFKVFWSYREMRCMVAACVVVCFASIMLSNIEIKISHNTEGDIKIRHDLSGNAYSPINLKLSDPGYPIKVEVRNN